MKITKDRSFKHRITVTYPQTEDTSEVVSFSVTFKALTRSQLAEFQVGNHDGQAALLRAVVIGWDAIIDGRDGSEAALSFSAEALELLLDDVWIVRALMDGYGAALVGAKRGN
jgi:hypothetical protein